MERKIDGKEYIDATKLTLHNWLALLTPENEEKYAFIYWSFPTDSMKKEYIDSIQNRTEKEVINLLRNFLIHTGSLGSDENAFDFLFYLAEHDRAKADKLMETEYYKRLIQSLDRKSPVWEGNTWVIDLATILP